MPLLKPKKNKQPKQNSLSNNEENRKERAKFYGSTKWRKLRLNYIMYNPLCEQCLQDNRTTPATQVHHKDSFMNYSGWMRTEMFFNQDNLMALCEECHGKIHGECGRTQKGER